MKKTFLKIAIASASTLLASASTLAYDVFDWRGSSAQENHFIHVNSPPTGDLLCGPGCAAFNGAGGAELQIGFIVDNLYDIFPGEGSGGVGSVAECYDAAPTRITNTTDGHAHLPTPLIPALVPENSGAAGGIPMVEVTICTDAEGKIVSGTALYLLNVGSGAFTAAFAYDFDNRLQTAWVGTGANGGGGNTNMPPTIAEVGGIHAGFLADTPVAPAPGDTFGGDDTWAWSSSAVFAYLTCDTDPQFTCTGISGGKAVPVPAFAAAALGFGLVGVTLLTSRRRQVA